MVMLHEEWLTVVVEKLGACAADLTDLGNGPTLRTRLAEFRRHVVAWEAAAKAETWEEKLAIENDLEMGR